MQATAREHLSTILMLTTELLKLSDRDLEDRYDLIQEADDALTDALNRGED